MLHKYAIKRQFEKEPPLVSVTISRLHPEAPVSLNYNAYPLSICIHQINAKGKHLFPLRFKIFLSQISKDEVYGQRNLVVIFYFQKCQNSGGNASKKQTTSCFTSWELFKKVRNCKYSVSLPFGWGAFRFKGTGFRQMISRRGWVKRSSEWIR